MFEQRVKNVHGTKGEDREHVERGSGVIECLACGTAMDIIEQAWIDGMKKEFRKIVKIICFMRESFPSTGSPLEDIENLAINICITLNIEPEEVCRGIVYR